MAFIVLIEGGTSSGKSTISGGVVQELRSTYSVALIRQDNYYKDLTGLSTAKIKDYNFDSPQAFDNEVFEQDIKKLANGKAIFKRKYDFINHTNQLTKEIIEPAEFIVCEGLFVFNFKINADFKIFIETDDDIRFIRRLQRDQKERSISPEETINNYLKTVKPMHDKYIKPAVSHADLVVKNDQPIADTVCFIVSEIKKRKK